MKLFLLLWVAVFIQVVVEIYYSRLGVNNLEIENNGMFLETALLGIVYLTAAKGKKYHSILYYILGIYVCILIGSRVFFHVPNKIDPIENILGKAVIIIYGILFLYNELKLTTKLISQEPIFWVAAGSLLYSGGTIIIFGLGDVLTNLGSAYFVMAWYINFILVIIANIVYTKAFLCSTR